MGLLELIRTPSDSILYWSNCTWLCCLSCQFFGTDVNCMTIHLLQSKGQARLGRLRAPNQPTNQPTSLTCPTLQPRKGPVIYLSFVHCMARFKVGPVVLKAKKSKSKSQSANPKKAKSQHHTVPLTPSLRMQASSLRLAQTELERDGSLQKISPSFYCQRWKVSGYFIKIYTRHLPFYFPIYSYTYCILTRQKPPAYELLLLTG